MCPQVTFERQEILDLIWSKPMQAVAREIGISDVALAKACKRCNIPKPRQVHWNKPEGKRDPNPKLGPAPGVEYYRQVHLHVMDGSVREAMAAKEATAPSRIVGEILVPRTLSGAHPLIVRTHGGLQKEARDGRVVWGQGSIDIRVSKLGADRALRLMSALMKASTILGDTWSVGKENTMVNCEGTPLRVRLSERFSKRELTRPTGRSAKAEPYWGLRYEWVGTGELTFQVDEHTLTPVRKVWKDTVSSQLENRLSDILAVLPQIARAVQVKEEHWQRQRDESERRATEARRLADEIEAQRQLRNRLTSTVQAWERAERIRSFCAAVAASPLGESKEAGIWRLWAESQAAELDPLSEGSGPWLPLTPPKVNWVSQDERENHGWWPAPRQVTYAHE